MKRLFTMLLLSLAPSVTTGCQTGMTLGEATEALNEASVSSQATDLASAEIELTTNFTIGMGVKAAAAELGTFVRSQLPCADVQIADATLTVTYGAKPGMCFYRGHLFSGKSTVTVARNDMGDVLVDHTWSRFSNGLVEVSGTAKVTWSTANASRRVQHDLTWTRSYDKRTGRGTGDRTQRALPEGILVGMQVDGARAWEGPAGRWDLSIQGVQMRWADPIPQAGSYTLMTPAKKSATLTFRRIDDDTLQATLTSGRATYKFKVNRAMGEVEAM